MVAVFVHGNPETAAVWAPLIAQLATVEAITLSPPGFGAAVPAGFGATADDYLAWLVTELETIGVPVDVVGHDWGGNHVLRLASARPDLLRSWCTDTAGVFAPDYVWHEASQIWMTPGRGEKSVQRMLDIGIAERAELYVSLGMTAEVAEALSEAFDPAMARCILDLYRSAAGPALAQWRDRLPAASARPGLAVIPTQDHYTGGESLHRWTAERTGAQVALLEDLGHWWLVQQPARAAETLLQFWSGLD